MTEAVVGSLLGGEYTRQHSTTNTIRQTTRPVRNLAFLVVVLVHGFSRLLPPY